MKQHRQNARVFAGALGLMCVAWSGQAFGSTVVAPVSAFADSQFPSANASDYSIFNTINQSGLSLGYQSGVTDFTSYIASKPKHKSNAKGNEWFSKDYSKSSGPSGSHNFFGANGRVKKKKNATSSPLLTITYGFSQLTAINALALWNEEFAGIGTTKLMGSADGITYTLLDIIKPLPSKFAKAGKDVPYGPQIFSFDVASILFFQLVIMDCPGPPKRYSKYRGCGIGEVAFSMVPGPQSEVPEVPVPAALPLLGSALGFAFWMGKRQRKAGQGAG